MDIVYVVGPGVVNEELRFSFRSLGHLPHDRVWIAGNKPQFATNVDYISVQQRKSKYENSTANVLAACHHPEVSDEFVLMNDDFFVMEPLAEVPTLHRGPIAEALQHYRYTRSSYVRGMTETKALLETLGCPGDLLSYELHVPMVVHKGRMIEVLSHGLRAGIQALHKRTLYGNLAGIGGELVPDCKVIGRSHKVPSGPFVSTSNGSFGAGWVGRHIRKTFPDPSPYERSIDAPISSKP